MNDDDFKEYRRLFIAELERLSKEVDRLKDGQQGIKTDLKVLQFKVASASAIISIATGAVIKIFIK